MPLELSSQGEPQARLSSSEITVPQVCTSQTNRDVKARVEGPFSKARSRLPFPLPLGHRYTGNAPACE